MKEISIEPRGDTLIVLPLKESMKTKSGFIRPDISAAAPQHGLVLAVGPGSVAELTGVRTPVRDLDVGDLVLYGRHAGIGLEHDDVELVLLREVEAAVRQRKGTFTVVEHDDPNDSHLDSSWCELCDGAKDEEAKGRLAAMREELLAGDMREVAERDAPAPVTEGGR